MEKKKFWLSKTFWSGIGTIATGVYLVVQGNVPEGIATIITGVGAIAGRTVADQPLGV